MDVISELIHYHSLNQFTSKHKVPNRPIIFVHKFKVSLLRRLFTRTSLLSSRNIPLVMDSLTTSVMRGAIVSRQSLRSIVGMRSLSPLLLGHSLMQLVTCSTVKGLKELRTGAAEHWATRGAGDSSGLTG